MLSHFRKKEEPKPEVEEVPIIDQPVIEEVTEPSPLKEDDMREEATAEWITAPQPVLEKPKFIKQVPVKIGLLNRARIQHVPVKIVS